MIVNNGQKEEAKQEVLTATEAPKENVPAVEEKSAITDAMVTAWKRDHGKIFKSIIGSDTYVWRKIKRKEYVEMMSNRDQDPEADTLDNDIIYDRQTKIAKAVVLWPKNIEELLEHNAGLATTISDEAILKSGFNLMATQEL